MRSLAQIALLALPLLARAAADEPPASPSPTKGLAENAVRAIYANANEAFQDLLNALPEESLHVALNSLSHFRDGVFESDRRGVEHIHNDNPPLATKLIVAAVQDLKKRQQSAPSNETAPTTQSQEPQSTNPPESTQAPPESTNPPESTQAPPESTQAPPESTEASPESSQAPSETSQARSETSQAPPQTSSQNDAPRSSARASRSSAVLVPVPIGTTTDSQGRTSVRSSEILSAPTASVAIPVTRTNDRGETSVVTETKPAVIFSTTDSAGSAFVTTTPIDFAPTSGQVLTRTNAEGGTFVTTYTPGSGRVSSIVLKTTTGEHGEQMVVTSYTYVDPQAATASGGDAPENTAQPSLQRGGAERQLAVDSAVLGGVMAGALAWFA